MSLFGELLAIPFEVTEAVAGGIAEILEEL